jgi:hypothetical protein
MADEHVADGRPCEHAQDGRLARTAQTSDQNARQANVIMTLSNF